MTLNNQIEVYFHMRNHYKRLKQVKSVVDSSAPKGRSRKKSKSPKRAKSPKRSKSPKTTSARRNKSSSRPPTRRNPKDMPILPREVAREVSASITTDHQFMADSVKSKTSEVIDTFVGDQHEYLQFSLRITEDIIKNDLYTNDQMRQVLNSHYEANKGRLSNDKMMTTMLELCKELNIPFCECDPTISPSPPPVSPRTMCICESKQVQTAICVPCECAAERNPPIQCRKHSHEINITEPVEPVEEQKKISEEINVSSPERAQKCVCGSPSCDSNLCQANDDSPVIEHVVEEKQEIPETKIEQEQEEQPIPEAIKEEVVDPTSSKCHCGNECCDRDRLFIFLDHYEKKLAHPKNIHEFGVSHYMTYIEPKETCTTDLSIQTSQHNMPSKPKIIESKKPHSADLSIQTTHHNLPSKVIEPFSNITAGCACGTTTTTYLKEPRKKQIGVGTSMFCACKEPETVKFNREQKFECPNLEHEQNDFIIFEGPVLIPKSTLQSVEGSSKAAARKNSEYVTNYCSQPHVEYIKSVQFTAQTCSGLKTNSSVSSDYLTNLINEPQKYDYSKKPHVLYHKNYDYDLTPQKDTLLYESNVKCEKTPCCSCKTNRNSNLLLGGQYDKIICVEEIETNKYTKFYPSIATQVTSMELLGKLPNKPVEKEVRNLSSARITPVSHVVSISLPADAIARQRTSTLSSEDVGTAKSSTSRPTFRQSIQSGNDDIFKSLDRVPQVCSTDSMDQRIDMLRSEMEKYREAGEDDFKHKSADDLPIDEAVEELPDPRYDFKTTDVAIRGGSLTTNSKIRGKVSMADT